MYKTKDNGRKVAQERLEQTSTYKFCKRNNVLDNYERIREVAAGLIAMPNDDESLEHFKKRIIYHLEKRVYDVVKIKASSSYGLMKLVKKDPELLIKDGGDTKALPNGKSTLNRLNEGYRYLVGKIGYDTELYKTRPRYSCNEDIYQRIIQVTNSIDKFVKEIKEEVSKG